MDTIVLELLKTVAIHQKTNNALKYNAKNKQCFNTSCQRTNNAFYTMF